MIKIITDSTSYIPKEWLEEYDISVVSLNIYLNNKSIPETEISNHDFYKEMEKSNEIPTSSQPSPEVIYTTFKKIIKNGDTALGIFISSEFSGTYNTAISVKNELLETYPEATIEVMDSRANCMQLGFIALVAAKAAKQGKTLEQVMADTQDAILHSRILFTPETLTYLKKGGRIGGASALLGTLLQIKPILTVVDGKTAIYSKVRTKKKAVDALVNGLMEDLKERDLGDVIVHHINCPDEGNELAKRLAEQLNHPVRIQSIGPVIGLHVGPGSIGLAYYTLPKK